MSKLKKQLILSGVVLVLAIALVVVYAVFTAGDTEDDKNVEVRDQFGVLMRGDRHFMTDPVDVNVIDSIKVVNTLDEYTLVHKGSEWTFEGVTGYDLNLERVSLLRSNTRYLLAVDLVENADLSNLEKYGINRKNPSVFFEVNYSKNKSYKVFVGEKTPDSRGYYACLDGRDALYILDTGVENSVLLELNDYITPSLTNPISQNETLALTRLSIFRKGDAFLRIDMVKDALTYGNSSTHRLTYPAQNFSTNLANFPAFLEAMASLTCEKTVLFGDRITPDALQALGFIENAEEHICDYTLTAEYPTQTIILHFIDKGESYLIYSENENIVVTAPKASFAFLEWELISWISSEIYLLDIFDVASVEFSSDKKEMKFDLSGEDELEVLLDGKACDVERFKALYKSIMYVIVVGWGEEPETSSDIMSLRIVLESGEELLYNFKTHSAVNSFYTLNGVGQFFVERDKVISLKEAFETF